MNTKIQQLLNNAPVILDGAWGTQLQNQGLKPGECPDLWNLTNPELVHNVAKSYVDAGSQIILTNTFGSNKISLERHGNADKAAQLTYEGVKISKQAADGKATVFASIGPSGKLLMMGQTTEEELISAYNEQLEAVVSAGAEGIVIETMSDLEEAVIALKIFKKSNLPVIVSMAFDSGKDLDRTMMGVTTENAANELTDNGVDVIGANCGQGPEGLVTVCGKLKEHSNLPVWIKANAGLPIMKDGKAFYAMTSAEFGTYYPKLVTAGASFIGGCCGTSPEFIRELVSVKQA